MRLVGVLAIFIAILISLIFATQNSFASDNLSTAIYSNGFSALRSAANEKRILQLINDERAKTGAGSLIWESNLAMAARNHSSNMASENYFGHKDRNGRSLVDRLKEVNLKSWSGLAENLYFCQGFDDPSTAAVAGWLKSSGHRLNLLKSSWKYSGIGMATTADGKVYVTQIFMR